MEITKTKTGTLSQKRDSLAGNTSPASASVIKNGSSMCVRPLPTPWLRTDESVEIFSEFTIPSEGSPSIPRLESVGWRSSSPSRKGIGRTPKMSSEVSQTRSSRMTKISRGNSTSIPSSESPGESMSELLSEIPPAKNPNAPDLLYILGRGSKWRNNEIRFSLRSVEKYLPHARIFVIGECPKFLRNVVHIPALDAYDNKLTNAIFKIRSACREIDLSEQFVLMNDDFFFLRHTPRIESFILGKTRTAIANHSTKAGYYFSAMRKTQDLLNAAGHTDPDDYEVHYPMMIEKQKFLEITDAIEWEQDGYLFRSLYGNTYEIGGKRRKDTKLHNIEDLDDLAAGDLLSTADRVVLRPEFQHFIYNHFPNPSRYEAPETNPGRIP